MMLWRWLMVVLLAAVVAGKGKKHRHQKPGRALFDRLSSSPVEPGPAAAGGTAGLLPAPLDAAPYATVVANATCGEHGEEEYCRQTPGKRGIVCGVCEGEEGARARRHPAAHVLDGAPGTWWQSPALAQGEEYRHVELMVTLPDVMELLHVIIKSGPAPRPLAWALEVSSSMDEDDWRLIRAFGDKEHCRKLWDLRPERRRRKARSPKGAKRTNRAEKPTCSTQFSSPRPLENGEMHVAIGEGVSARRVRISFRAAHPAPPEQQFYAVRSLTLAARCLCLGHAENCEVDKEGTRCSCVHETCGNHCERQDCTGSGVEARGECSCGERGQCLYDDTGAIYCVNCTENRAGPLCDRCLPGFYNAVPDGPCLPCECHPDGSDGTCHFNQRLRQPTCSCFPGVMGPACDSCIDTAAIFPSCDVIPTTHACKCDPQGIVDPEGICDSACVCKPNVIGERCDTCAAGYWGLHAPAGCQPCYCSGAGDSCVEDMEHGEDMALHMAEDQWTVTDLDRNQTVAPSADEEGWLYLNSYEVEGWQGLYWSGGRFHGAQLGVYGGAIRASLHWEAVRGDAGGSPIVGPDFVIVGRDGTKLAYGSGTHAPGPLTLIAPLTEGPWYLLDDPGAPVGRQLMMDVLSDVTALMVRAHYHSDQDEVRLQSVEFKGAPPGAREVCSCGISRGGAHCERCSSTHVRLPLLGPLSKGDPSFDCVPCDCNGHASCESVDGPCGECQHNTTGAHCERCLPGYYGNPVQGGCKPCACPLYMASNNFSPNCILAHADGDEFVCTQCPEGYAGDHCETCDIGYWGSPTTPGGSCTPCDCGGSPCDASGKCLQCPPNTEGASCEQCQEGFYFDPEVSTNRGARSCIPCACGAGALALACDAQTGQCACAAGWAGRACDICQEGHGDTTKNCPVCACGIASLSPACDPLSGDCACAVGAAGSRCDRCMNEHYGLSEQGCLANKVVSQPRPPPPPPHAAQVCGVSILLTLLESSKLGRAGILTNSPTDNKGRAKREQSLEELRRHIHRVYVPLQRQFMVLFPEGGFLHKRREVSQRFAEKNNLPKLEYVSLPRAGAMKVIMEEVGPRARKETVNAKIEKKEDIVNNSDAVVSYGKHKDSIEWILDVTIAYDARVPLHLQDIVCGIREPCTTHLHYRLYPSTDVPPDTEGMTQWLYDRFVEKDRLLEEFYRTGKFPATSGAGGVRTVRQDNLRYLILHLFFIASTCLQLRILWAIIGYVW